jgi:ParB family transcriptional regulator, chromosome partitioning protein
VTAAAHSERVVALADLGECLSALRLADAAALRAMRASLKQHGQLSPVRAFERDGAVEIFDGFKRLRAARLLGLRDLRAVVSEVDVIDATVQMRELHAGRGLTALEEAWIVRALYRDHHVSQGAIAAQLRCHKSWVCRRLVLVEALEATVQADVRLGLLAPRAAVLLGALPRGNQSAAAAVVIRRGLTVGQTALLVRELADAAEPAARAAVLARWGEGRRPVRPTGRVRAAHGIAETIALDAAAMQRSAGRLQARLIATPLAAMGPAADVLRKSLGDLDGVLRTLSQTIAGALTQAVVA